ncbi:barwin-like endoglucanase [Meredithblackwellia eburnea MCA 4105]
MLFNFVSSIVVACLATSVAAGDFYKLSPEHIKRTQDLTARGISRRTAPVIASGKLESRRRHGSGKKRLNYKKGGRKSGHYSKVKSESSSSSSSGSSESSAKKHTSSAASETSTADSNTVVAAVQVHATTKTSSAQAAATTTSSSSSSSDTMTGQATWYTQDGNPGACGNYNSDSALIVALQSQLYSQSYCGKTVVITNTANGKSVTATVADECPGCATKYSLDLSTGAFDSIGSADTGVLSISWYFAN